MKYSNNDEEDGEWGLPTNNVERIFKEASTGRIERRLYTGKEFRVIEVIQEGEKKSC
jgi:hypothetical protein